MLTPTNLQQQKAVWHALRQRCAIATEEFYNKAGIKAPPSRLRYRVEGRGGSWAVVDQVSGRLHGQCRDYDSALRYAQQLEVAYLRRGNGIWSARWMGEATTRYVSLFGLVLLGAVIAWG